MKKNKWWRWPAKSNNYLYPWYRILWHTPWYFIFVILIMLCCVVIFFGNGPSKAKSFFRENIS